MDIMDSEKLILRDKLAAERTRLAMQRTFLAYMRTAVALFGAGLALVKILDVPAFLAIGWAFMALSPIVLVWGYCAVSESKRRQIKYIKDVINEDTHA